MRWVLETNHGPIGVRAAAQALHIAPSTAHALITSLVAEGYLQRSRAGDEKSGYVLGHEFLMLAHKAVGRLPLRDMALPHMRALVSLCNEAAFLNVYNRDRQEFFAIASVESTHELRYVVEMYKWKPVYVSAAGWAIMAHLSRAERDEISRRTKLKALTPHSITDPVLLETHLAEVRARGYAISRGQRILGAVGLSAPIFDPQGQVIGGVGISMPEFRVDETTETRLSALLIECTRAITRDIASGRSR
jgi:DNA-binding IclR family transcriptional regulator